MPYATADCDVCGIILPRNELFRVTETRVVGSYVNGGSKTKTGDIYLCNQHWEIRRAAIAAANRRRIVGWSILTLIAVGIVGWIASARPSPKETSTAPAAIQVNQTTGPDAAALATSSPSALPPTPSPDIQQPEPLSNAPSASSSSAGLDDYSTDIQVAIRSALNSGEPKQWRDGDQTGWITVSELGGRDNTCRSFQVVHGDVKDQAINVCRHTDGIWSPR